MLAISPQLGTSRLITLDLPAALSPRVLNALTADPVSVDLRALAPHFYGLGARVLELFEDEELVEGLDARERGLVDGGVLGEVLVDVRTTRRRLERRLAYGWREGVLGVQAARKGDCGSCA